MLKLIGDGILAIFAADDRAHACAAALAAATAARSEVAALKCGAHATALPVTDMYLGLHVGEVFYGNIGSIERLDFTVVGPAVNETSRIAAMCRSVEQPVLVSEAFANVDGMRGRLVSVGRYALRGVAQPQELFTLEFRPNQLISRKQHHAEQRAAYVAVVHRQRNRGGASGAPARPRHRATSDPEAWMTDAAC